MELSEVLVYLIKVMIIQGVFYLFYWLALRNKLSHSFNRIYLLSTLLVAFVIPFVNFPVAPVTSSLLASDMIVWIAEPITAGFEKAEISESSFSFPVWPFVIWSYFGIAVFLIARSSLHLWILQKLKKQSEYINNIETDSRSTSLPRIAFPQSKYRDTCLPDRQVKPTEWVKKYWFKLFKTTQSRPFSFFSSVFIPRDIFGTKSFDQIVAHECVHVRQLHSLDRLLVDFLVSLFWFNPFIYLYRRALIEVHEYQADASVVKQFDDLIGYQEILYSQLRTAPYSGLVSHFNFSTIKKRIVMMNKSKTKGQSKFAYVLTVPVVVLVLFAFTSKEGENSVRHITDKIEEITAPFESEEIINESAGDQEDRYKPSILPLKSTAKFKVTSGFGKRQDPKGKQSKWHPAIDFGTPMGTLVLSTADGEVHSLTDSKEGFGKWLVINHGDDYSTKYAHLSEFKVKKGEKVKKGDVIALSGNSGWSNGPHLHYEVAENGKRQNPMDFIKNYKFKPLVKEIAPPPPPAKNPEEEKTLQEVQELASELEQESETVLAERLEQEMEARDMAMEAKDMAMEARDMAMEAHELAAVEAVLADKQKVTAVHQAELAERAAGVARLEVKLAADAKELAEVEAEIASVVVVEITDDKFAATVEKLVKEIKAKQEMEKKQKLKDKKKDKKKLKNKVKSKK